MMQCCAKNWDGIDNVETEDVDDESPIFLQPKIDISDFLMLSHDL